MRIGWFGIPGVTPSGTTTHVAGGGKVLCGWKPRPGMEFQWCANVNSATVSFIECLRCRAKTSRLMKGLVPSAAADSQKER